MSATITPYVETAEQFVNEWFTRLDVHAPLQTLLPMLADQGLEFRVPETTMHNHADFARWYANVTNTYFDEVHTLRQLHTRTAQDTTEIHLVVRWEASSWQAPSLKSKREAFDATQHWVLKQFPGNDRPVILSYTVDALTPVPLTTNDSAGHEVSAQTRETINAYYQAVNSGNWDVWLTLFADDVVMQEQLAGQSSGLAAMYSVVESFKRGYSKFLMHPQHILVDGNQAAVVWHCEAANAQGVPIDAWGANYFRVREGKIVVLADYHDTVPFAPFTNQQV